MADHPNLPPIHPNLPPIAALTAHQHYGIVHEIVCNEGEGIGNLSITAMLDPSPNFPDSRIVCGSTASSENDLGQFALSAVQANKVIGLLWRAVDDIERATGVITPPDDRTAWIWRAWTGGRERLADTGYCYADSEQKARQNGWAIVGGPHIADVVEIQVDRIR